MLGQSTHHRVRTGTVIILILRGAEHDVQIIGGVEVQHEPVCQRFLVTQPLALDVCVIVVTFFVGVIKGGSEPKITGDRPLDITSRSRLTLRAIVELNTAFELVSRLAGNDVDGA